jgi:thiamine-phosphate pyrophosphorylase
MNSPSSGACGPQSLRGLYVLTDERMGGGHEAIARAALAGGARVLQLRDKSTPPNELLSIARRLRVMTREANAVLLINDRPELAARCEADGVHLGPDDASPEDARRLLGPQAIVGVSCGDAREAVAAWRAGASYVGAGSLYATATKGDAGEPIGLEGLRAIVRATPLPVAAIGGITLQRAPDVARAGAAMLCAISSIAGAGDEEAMARAARAMRETFELPAPQS